jgi:hypothetical protein
VALNRRRDTGALRYLALMSRNLKRRSAAQASLGERRNNG